MEPRILNHIASQAVHRVISKIISSNSNWVSMDYTYNGIEYRGIYVISNS